MLHNLKQKLLSEGQFIMPPMPKRIFYVWLGSQKPADVLMAVDQWRRALPDYEIVELGEHSEKYFDFTAELKNNAWFKTVYEKKIWAYAADYIRCKALYDHGGIYLDTDISIVKSFDDLLDESAFIGKQSADSVNLAIIGAKAHNPFIKDILDFYAADIWQKPIFSIPDIGTWLLENKYNVRFGKSDGIIRLPELSIYPESWFYPYAYHSVYNADCIKPETHTIHWWKEGWCKSEITNWLKQKHLRSIAENQKAELMPRYRFYLFGFLRCFDYSAQDGWVRLSGFRLPLLKIKKVYNRTKVLLFNLIPLLKVRS